MSAPIDREAWEARVIPMRKALLLAACIIGPWLVLIVGFLALGE